MKPRALVIYPRYGLANRLRAIASAKILADYTGRRLFVNWARYRKCNAEWGDLFVTPFQRYPMPLSGFQAGRNLYDDSIETRRFSQDMPLSLVKNNSDVVAVRAFQNFRPPEMTDEEYKAAKSLFYRSLQPVWVVQKAVGEFQKRFFEGQHVVGIHIRRTDHLSFDKRDHKKICPTDFFIEAIERILKARSGTKFFLSTDDKKEEQRIMRLFPGSIIVYGKEEVRRDTLGGMQDALTDWLLLSSTSRIIGSYASSFSEEAASVNMIPADYALRTEEFSRIHYRAAVRGGVRDLIRGFKKALRRYRKTHLSEYAKSLYGVLKEEGLKKFVLYSYAHRRKQIIGILRRKISRSG